MTASNNSKENALDERVIQVLSNAGVTASEMDPLSLDSLCQHLSANSSHSTTAATYKEYPAITSYPTASNPLVDFSGSQQPWGSLGVVDPSALFNGDSQEAKCDVRQYRSSSSTNEIILWRLDEQTRLILELQGQVKELTRQVIITRSSGTRGSIGASQTDGIDSTSYGSRTHDLSRENPPNPRIENEGPPAARLHMLAQVQNYWRVSMQYLLDTPTHVRNSRIMKLFRLYTELQRRQAPNFDASSLMKVLIMMGLIIARLNRNSDASSNDLPQPDHLEILQARGVSAFLSSLWKAYLLHFSAACIIVGFVIQSGFYRFLYNFFVKEDFPARIWNGEDINVEQAMTNFNQRRLRQRPPRQGDAERQPHPLPQQQQPDQLPPRPRPAAAQAEAQVEIASADAAPNENEVQNPVAQYILAGHIPQRDDLEQPPMEEWPIPIRWGAEIGLLVSSFILSIFPAWQPQAMPVRQQQQEHQQQEQQHLHQDANEENENIHDGQEENDGEEDP